MATTIQTIELPKKYRALDTSGNNNHGQIYSGRGLEFDGVSDYLTTGYGSGLNPTTADVTIALWAKPNVTDDNIVTGIDHAGGATRLYVGSHSEFWDIGVQSSPWNNTTTGGVLADRKKLNINTWYRLVVVLSGTTATMYVNGVQSISKTYSSYTFNSGFYIGNQDTDTDHAFDGKVSDFQIWNATWSATDVTYDYLNPESLALNNSDSSLTNSNLKLWYPMQDGHRGQQSYILDGANTGLGDESVVNGDFATTSSWSEGSEVTSFTVLNNIATIEGLASAFNTRIGQTITTKAGQTYKITGSLRSNDGDSYRVRTYNGGYSDVIFGNSTSFEAFEHYITAVSTSIVLYFSSHYSSGSSNFSITNPSVKAINDKNHATTVFYGDNLLAGVSGAADGDFEDSGNTPAFAATYSSGSSGITYDTDNTSSPLTGSKDGKVTNAAGVNAGIISDAITLVTGRTYKVGFNYLTNYNASSQTNKLRFKIGETQVHDSSNIDSTGGYAGDDNLAATSKTAYSQTFVHTDSDTEVFIVLFGGDGLVFQIDDVYFKEVGVASGWTDADQQLHIPQTALQSYNELTWFDGVADYVQLSDPYNHNLITISAWIYLNEDTILYRAIFANRDSSEDGLIIAIKPEETLWAKFNGTAATSSTTVSTGKWYHVVYTYDDATMKVYMNGVLEGSTAFTTSDMAVTTNAKIGLDSQSAQYYFPGSITEVSIWGAALSLAEIQELYNDGKALDATIHSKAITASTNLKGYFRNNGLSTWTDLSDDYSNDGTPTSMTETLLLPAGVDATRDNQGFIMNRQKDTSSLNLTSKGDEYVVVPDASTIQLASTAASWCMWIKLDSLSDGDQKLLSKAPSAGNTSSVYQIRTSDDNLLFQIYSGGWYSDTRSTFFTSTDWTHVVVTIDGSNNVNFYKNGDVFGSEADVGAAVPANTGNLNIGTRVQSAGVYDEFLKGKIDGILLYNKELSSTEVKRNYNAGKGSHRN